MRTGKFKCNAQHRQLMEAGTSRTTSAWQRSRLVQWRVSGRSRARRLHYTLTQEASFELRLASAAETSSARCLSKQYSCSQLRGSFLTVGNVPRTTATATPGWLWHIDFCRKVEHDGM